MLRLLKDSFAVCQQEFMMQAGRTGRLEFVSGSRSLARPARVFMPVFGVVQEPPSSF